MLKPLKSLAKPFYRFYQRRRFWPRYAANARRLGLDSVYLLLSFDCDSPEDAEAAAALAPWLKTRSIKTTYAVPGEQLQQSAGIYRTLAGDGADFMNHGALPHTARAADGSYYSITFYHQMTPGTVATDIRRGHQIVQEVTGRVPVGFRAPHFGLYQASDQLALIYRTLREIGGYRYASTTRPRFAMQHGPAYPAGGGLWEVPVMGTWAQPFNILDSWSNLSDKHTRTLDPRYAARFIQTIDRLQTRQIPAVLTYYADPAHLTQNDVFKHALAHAIERGVQSLSYPDLFVLLDRKNSHE